MPGAKKIDKLSFYKWKTEIEKMAHAQTKFKFEQLKCASMEKDIEIQKLKVGIAREHLSSYRDNFESQKASYEQMKESIEKKLGYTLDGCAINEYTLEVTRIDKKEE